MAWFDLPWQQLLLRLTTGVAVWAVASPLAAYLGLALLLRFLWSPFSGSRFWTTKSRELPPEVLQDASLGEHAYVTLDKGIKLHYVHKGDTTRPLMVFLHGFPEFWFSWKQQLQEFSKDYWVVAVDMRGYGDSDKPSGVASYRADILVDDVKELLDAFERRQAILVGHGWGAAVAWMFSERYPERVVRLASIGAPHPYVFQRAVALNRKQFLRTWYLFLFQVPYLPELLLRCDDLACLATALRRGRRQPPALSDQDLEAYKYTFGRPGALTGPLNYYRAAGWGLPRRWQRPRPQRPQPHERPAEDNDVEPESCPVTATPNLTEQLLDQEDNPAQGSADSTTSAAVGDESEGVDAAASSAPPALVILGGRDAYVETSTAFRTRKKFPNVSVVIVRDANHFVHLDEPEIVNKALRKFLA